MEPYSTTGLRLSSEGLYLKYTDIICSSGRLIPGIRQYISLPAGLARMNIYAFSIATAFGAGIWVIILAAIGYAFGRNENLIIHNLHWATLATIIICGILLLVQF